MRVATTQFSLKAVARPQDFWRRVKTLCETAKAKKADAILFPEYFPLSFLLTAQSGDFRKCLLESEGLEAEFLSELRALAERLDMTIIAGTFPHAFGGILLNRSWIMLPGESPIFQDKVNMTRFESEEWHISPGKPEMKLFRVAGALCAVAICYDVEFPQYCAAAAEKKVDVLFVPSCTDDVHGYWRVRHCAEARAIENQSFVVMSSVVEGNPAVPEIASHYGKGVVLSPCDIGFPEAGILKEGAKNKEGVAVAELDLRAIQRVRKNGTVLNLRDSGNRAVIQALY